MPRERESNLPPIVLRSLHDATQRAAFRKLAAMMRASLEAYEQEALRSLRRSYGYLEEIERYAEGGPVPPSALRARELMKVADPKPTELQPGHCEREGRLLTECGECTYCVARQTFEREFIEVASPAEEPLFTMLLDITDPEPRDLELTADSILEGDTATEGFSVPHHVRVAMRNAALDALRPKEEDRDAA